MRPYFTDLEVKKRLAKLRPDQRKYVREHARREADRRADIMDMTPEVYAILPRHLDECGYGKVNGVRSASVLEAFIDHWLEELPAQERRDRIRPDIRQRLARRAGRIFDDFCNFQAGWKRGIDSQQ